MEGTEGYLKTYRRRPLFIIEWYENTIVRGEFERIGVEAVIAYFKVLTRHSCGGTE
jgi:hypothetical protein